MKIPPVIHGLAAKRSKIAAEIEWLQARLERCQRDLATVEAALALWEEGKYVRSVRRSYREHPGPFKWRELPRLIVEILRSSDRPLTTGEIQARICVTKGLDMTDPNDRRSLSRRVNGAINDQRRQGRIEAAGKIADRYLWSLTGRL